MFHYHTISPCPELTPYVRFFWVLEGILEPGENYAHRTLADGCAELVFHYRTRFNELTRDGKEQSSGLAALSGPAHQYARFIATQSFSIFGVYLYPFAINAFFNIPASAVASQLTDIDLLLGAPGKQLEESILEATDTDQRVKIISEFLVNSLHKNQRELPPIARAVTTLIRQQGNFQLNKLSSQFYLSERQFERNFKNIAGFTPKLYARIVRFQQAISSYGNKPRSLTELAYECGYYDQSHFIHDFREFSGLHPREYFSGQSEASAWRD